MQESKPKLVCFYWLITKLGVTYNKLKIIEIIRQKHCVFMIGEGFSTPNYAALCVAIELILELK